MQTKRAMDREDERRNFDPKGSHTDGKISRTESMKGI